MPTTPLGETVHALRESRGWTMGQLAAYADLTTGYISKLEAGKVAAPAIDVLQRLARALRVEVDVLTGQQVLPDADPLELIRQGLTQLERERPGINLKDPKLAIALEEVGGELTEDELDGIRPFVERALRRKRDREQGA